MLAEATQRETRSRILRVTVPQDIDTLGDLIAALSSIRALYDITWKLDHGLANAIHSPSPASDPVPKTTPDLHIASIRQGSLLVEFFEDYRALAVSASVLGGGGTLWLAASAIRRGPEVLADFVADAVSMPDRYRATRASHAAHRYERQAAATEAQLADLNAKLKAWYVSEGSESAWLAYQRLITVSGPDLEARVVDEEGNELPDPRTLDG